MALSDLLLEIGGDDRWVVIGRWVIGITRHAFDSGVFEADAKAIVDSIDDVLDIVPVWVRGEVS